MDCDMTGQEVAAYWYSAVRQYDFLKEPDVLHANVNAGTIKRLNKLIYMKFEEKFRISVSQKL